MYLLATQKSYLHNTNYNLHQGSTNVGNIVQYCTNTMVLYIPGAMSRNTMRPQIPLPTIHYSPKCFTAITFQIGYA